MNLETTIYRQFLKTVKMHGSNIVTGVFTGSGFQTKTYEELQKDVDRFSAYLSKHCTEGDRVSLLLPNGPEWYTVDLACARIGVIVVPIHTTYSSSYVQKIIEHSGSKIIVCSGDLFDKHKDVLKKHSVLVTDGEREGAQLFSDCISTEGDVSEVSDESLVHTIIYTSGTTGDPKGVMLTHKNIMINARDAKSVISILPSDVFFSFLPLSHVFERTAGYYVPLFSGSAIYFARSITTLIEDLKKVRPTIFLAVPRIFERAHEKIRSKFDDSPVLSRVVRYAERVTKDRRAGTASSINKLLYAICDGVVFRKVRATFGGRLRFSVSGGASLAQHISEFFNMVGVKVVEGYGLTETSPVIAMNSEYEQVFGTVGKVLPWAEISLADDGEILVRGACVMKGYYHDDAATQEEIATDGWFRTGDLGELDAENNLRIVGRKKEVIVLSNGKNVHPVPIEQALEDSDYILQAMVYSTNGKSLCALLVINEALIADSGVPLDNKSVQGFYEQRVKELLSSFSAHEQIREIVITKNPFTIENGSLALTQKLRRFNIHKIYDL